MFKSPSTSRRFGLAAIAAAAIGSLTIPSAATAAGPASPPPRPAEESGNAGFTPGVSEEAQAAGRARHGRNPTAQEAIEAYWTPERMREATPIEKASFLVDAATRHSQKQAEQQDQAKGNPEKGGPKSDPKPGPQVDIAPGPGSLGVEAAYNPNLSSWHPTARTNGKVFFSMPGGNFVCSGVIVNTEGRDSVWTAGHCVHGGQGGSLAWNWSFVPSYDDDLSDPRPYGTWTAAGLYTRTAWINNSDFTEDIGVAHMNTRNGWHIADYFGGQGFSVNYGKNVWVDAMGYPAETPFDGGNLQRCWGNTAPEWTTWWGGSAETLKLSCDMTRGSSGGPWFRAYDGNWGYLYGINSRINQISGPTLMFSPYFDDTALSLLNYTRHM